MHSPSGEDFAGLFTDDGLPADYACDDLMLLGEADEGLHGGDGPSSPQADDLAPLLPLAIMQPRTGRARCIDTRHREDCTLVRARQRRGGVGRRGSGRGTARQH